MSEADARIKIDSALRRAGWRLPDDAAPNVRMEYPASKKGEKKRYPDYALLDERGFPLAVVEAKSAERDPLEGKEQAREYAQRLNVKFALLSNGDLHYFWDLRADGPVQALAPPGPKSLAERGETEFSPQDFAAQKIGEDYIVQTQGANTPKEQQRPLRDYQLRAVQAVRDAAAAGKRRFLLEMATGTGKTLIAAAVMKMFFRAGAARRILFLVDRLELEDQAKESLGGCLANDHPHIAVYKENKRNWRGADIVVSTVQSLAFGERYRDFSPLDFDLMIVDEAHRAIGGKNARAVFEHFIGFKLGLTATPRDFMRGASREELSKNNPAALDARLLRDTYATFGCENAPPTFRYVLEDGAREGFLVTPTIYDARTDITTRLLSSEGAEFQRPNPETGEAEEIMFQGRDYEKRLFSDATNRAFCRAFLRHAKKDPISGEIGKTIVYCVSQRHAGKIAGILNEMAAAKFGGKYNSNFARQVTSNTENAAEAARQFADNTLGDRTKFLEDYRSSRTRVCATVGMMTTGYDCPDILNLCVMRPVFSPHEFIQMKGRGTRPYVFRHRPPGGEEQAAKKDGFALFDFFAVVEYFESEHKYNEQLPLDFSDGKEDNGEASAPDSSPPEESAQAHIHEGADDIARITETVTGELGLRVDRETTRRLVLLAREDAEISEAAARGDKVKMTELITGMAEAHRREFRDRAELLDDEARKFAAAAQLPEDSVPAAMKALKAIIDDAETFRIIHNRQYAQLADNPALTDEQWDNLPEETREKIEDYVRDADLSAFHPRAEAA